MIERCVEMALDVAVVFDRIHSMMMGRRWLHHLMLTLGAMAKDCAASRMVFPFNYCLVQNVIHSGRAYSVCFYVTAHVMLPANDILKWQAACAKLELTKI